MDIAVSADDADQNFSQLLRGVQAGNTYTVTSEGYAIAKITPAPAAGKRDEDREASWQALMARLASQPARDIGPWTREELYDRE